MKPAESSPHLARIRERLNNLPGVDFSGDGPPFPPAMPADLAGFLGVAEQMARLVSVVHERGVTHCGIRPDRFRLRDGRPVLTGFGHAVTFGSSSAGFAPLDRLPEDAAYVAPEQTGRMNRPMDHRADLYALGCTLYSVATGQAPFPERDRLSLIHAHLANEPRSPGELAPWMPSVLSRMILRLLAKEPDDRYQSASGLADDLRRLREGAERGEPLDTIPLRAAERLLLPRPPRRCHGRENAFGELLSAFDSVSRGGRQCVFITGEAGVGKTSLANALQRPVALRSGRFVRGKCDQFQLQRPLLAPVQALQQLLTLVLGDDDESIHSLRSRLRIALGPDSGALHELLPEFANLLGDSPPPVALSPRETQLRLNGLLVRLIRVIASPLHPLVLVLDDLQWADRPTLDFITALLEEDQSDGLLIVGLFRSEEAEASPALGGLMKKSSDEPRATIVLHLVDLPPRDLDSLVGEMLGAPPEEIRDLSAEVHRTTRGNPFHAIELVQSLHREGALVFDSSRMQWTWNAAALAARPPSINVVEFLMRNLSDLPPATIETLIAAASLGADITLSLLARATGRTVDESVCALLPALERGVMVTPDAEGFTKGIGSARAVFRHDRMQQAAASLRDRSWRMGLQLAMARRLAAAADDPATAFRAAEQYAEASVLVEDPEEKSRAAVLFLGAARRARESGAVASALRFLHLALDLLAPDPWDSAFALSWDLHEELHLANYCLSEHAEADAVYAELRARAPGAEHLSAPAAIQVMSLSNRTRYEEALQLGSALLAEFGIAVPLDHPDEPLKEELDELYRAIDAGALQRLCGRRQESTTEHAAAKLMNRMVPAAFFCRPVVANWIIVHAARSWLAGRYDDALLYPMACLALATISARGDYATGYHAARAALTAGEAGECGVETARARHVFGLFNCHWFEPLERALIQAHGAHDALLRGGELEFACYTFFTSQTALLETADNLGDLDRENHRALAFAEKTGNRHALQSYTAFRHLLEALSSGGTVEEKDVPASNPMAECYHHLARALSDCILGNEAGLRLHAGEAVRLSPYITGFYPEALVNVLESLALLARRRSGDHDPAIAERVAENQDWLAARAEDAPANFAHLHDLIEAERLVADGSHTEALPVFERAIRRAKACHRPWHAALAAEKAARCYLALDLEQAGHRLIEQALIMYADWGAVQKRDAMEAEFPFLKVTAPAFREMQPLFDAIRQLASMRSVPQLTEATAVFLLKLSGATDVQILVLDEGDRWMLQAGYSGSQRLPRMDLDEAENKGLIPSSIIRLGLRLLRPVLSDDASVDTRLAGDPRFRGLERCAALGVPVVSQNRAVAFVVLENRRLRGAFTENLADMVGILCGHLAVSIENAHLYSSLEEKVEQRTHELRAVEKTLAQVAYELTENIPVGTYTMVQPPDGGMAFFSFLSRRFLELTGLDREEARTDPMKAFACVHPEDFDEWVRKNAYVFEHKLPFKEECRIIVKGKTRWIIAESAPRSLPDGSIVWEGVLTDITERKLAEEKLAASESELRRILDNIPIPIAINDLAIDARITFLNTTFQKTFGYTPKDIPTVSDWARLAYPDEHYRTEVFRIWDAALEKAARIRGSIESMEFRVRCRDGTFRDVLINAVALEEMMLVGFVDITGRKGAEQREKQLQAEHRRNLESKLKTSLSAAAIAHEINQPLSAILLQSNMALHGESGAQEALTLIAGEAQRVVSIIDKMKTLLRNVQTEHRPVHLTQIVQSTLLHSKSMLARQRITVVRSGLDQPCLIMGDDAQLQLALTNLLRNSAEAIAESGAQRREISIHLASQDNSVDLVIGDSGPGWKDGIPPNETPLTTTKEDGTGIGLYVARTAMENHGGRVIFGSSPLGGAEVTLAFPRTS